MESLPAPGAAITRAHSEASSGGGPATRRWEDAEVARPGLRKAIAVLRKRQELRSRADVASVKSFVLVNIQALRFFQTMSEALLTKLCETLSVQEIPEGEVIFHAGDEGDLLYIIVWGEAGVYIPMKPALPRPASALPAAPSPASSGSAGDSGATSKGAASPRPAASPAAPVEAPKAADALRVSAETASLIREAEAGLSRAKIDAFIVPASELPRLAKVGSTNGGFKESAHSVEWTGRFATSLGSHARRRASATSAVAASGSSALASRGGVSTPVLEASLPTFATRRQWLERVQKEAEKARAALEPPKPEITVKNAVCVARIKAGNAFGELALKDPRSKRSATILTQSASVLFTLSRGDLARAPDLRAILDASSEKVEFLRRLSWMRLVHSNEASQLAYSTQDVVIPRGATIVREGEASPLLYILRAGSCHLECRVDEERTAELRALSTEAPSIHRSHAVDSVPFHLGSIGPGTCFGEGFLLVGSPAEFTVVADTQVTVLEVGAELLRNLSPLAIEALAEEYCAKLRLRASRLRMMHLVRDRVRTHDEDALAPLVSPSGTPPTARPDTAPTAAAPVSVPRPHETADFRIAPTPSASDAAAASSPLRPIRELTPTVFARPGSRGLPDPASPLAIAQKRRETSMHFFVDESELESPSIVRIETPDRTTVLRLSTPPAVASPSQPLAVIDLPAPHRPLTASSGGGTSPGESTLPVRSWSSGSPLLPAREGAHLDASDSRPVSPGLALVDVREAQRAQSRSRLAQFATRSLGEGSAELSSTPAGAIAPRDAFARVESVRGRVRSPPPTEGSVDALGSLDGASLLDDRAWAGDFRDYPPSPHDETPSRAVSFAPRSLPHALPYARVSSPVFERLRVPMRSPLVAGCSKASLGDAWGVRAPLVSGTERVFTAAREHLEAQSRTSVAAIERAMTADAEEASKVLTLLLWRKPGTEKDEGNLTRAARRPTTAPEVAGRREPRDLFTPAERSVMAKREERTRGVMDSTQRLLLSSTTSLDAPGSAIESDDAGGKLLDSVSFKLARQPLRPKALSSMGVRVGTFKQTG